jgi:hypothetical protein
VRCGNMYSAGIKFRALLSNIDPHRIIPNEEEYIIYYRPGVVPKLSVEILSLKNINSTTFAIT